MDNSFVSYNNTICYTHTIDCYITIMYVNLGSWWLWFVSSRPHEGWKHWYFFRLNERFLRGGRYRGNNIDSVRASSFMIQEDRKEKFSEKKKKKNELASRSVELVSGTISAEGLVAGTCYSLCGSSQPGTGAHKWVYMAVWQQNFIWQTGHKVGLVHWSQFFNSWKLGFLI